MFKRFFIISVSFALLCSSAIAARIEWDASSGLVEGYVVYFSDGTENYTYHAGPELGVDNIEDTLNLTPGVAYTFTVKAYNSYVFSDDSNSVEYTKPGIVIPNDVLPGDVDVPNATTVIISQ